MDSELRSSAPRMSIVRLDDPSITLTAQFNPDELEETGGADYARQTVPGLSHKVKQFINTKDRVLKFTLRYMAIQFGSSGVGTLMQARDFIITSCLPRPTPGLVRSAGAPRLLFVWPNYFSLQAVLTDWSIKSQRFNKFRQLADLEMSITLEEVRDTLITADQYGRIVQ